MMEGPRHQHLHQKWQELLEEHVPKNRLPKRLMLPWIREPRVAGGQEMRNTRAPHFTPQHWLLCLMGSY